VMATPPSLVAAKFSEGSVEAAFRISLVSRGSRALPAARLWGALKRQGRLVHLGQNASPVL
jgi:hypothetical protein